MNWYRLSLYAVQARAAQGKAGDYLADRARTLEAEVENSKQTLATVLAPDPAERGSSGYIFVLARIGLGQSEKNACLPRGEDMMRGEGSESRPSGGGSQKKENAVGIHDAMMRAEISNRRATLCSYVAQVSGSHYLSALLAFTARLGVVEQAESMCDF